MVGIPVLKTKLIVPQLPPTVMASIRMQKLCDEMVGRDLITITAPAGYGKTTLMVTAIDRCKSEGYRICWYRLDEDDHDLAVFYTHLVETLFPKDSGLWDGPHDHLAACGDIFAQHRYLNALICQELWALHNLRIDLKTIIVFDDYQQITGSPDITNAIQVFIDNLPDKCTVIVSSRCETGLITGKRRLEKNILEITTDKLSFSEEELASFINNKIVIAPGQNLLQKIMLHTEGWPAGIVLVCQMLSECSDGVMGEILDRSGRKELLFQYIAAEVLKTVDSELLQFLVKGAILRDFTTEDAVAIFQETKAQQLLDQCEQNGLFVQKIPGTAITYRFHSLFREVLQQYQHRYLSPDELKNYHLQAAAYYINQRIFDRAIEHFITCGDIYSAVALVAGESARLVAFEAVDQLRLWFRLLPEELVSENAYLLFFKSFIFYQRDVNGALRLLEKALAIFSKDGDCAMQIHTLVAMAHLYVQSNNVPAIKKINRQMSAMSKTLQEPTLRDMLTVYEFSTSVWDENFTRAATLSRRIRSLTIADEWQWMVLCYSAIMYYLQGDLVKAENYIKEAQGLDLIKKADLLRGYIQVVYSTVLLLKDEQAGLAQITEELILIGEKYAYKNILGFGRRLKGCACYRSHDLESALDHLDVSTTYFEELGNDAMASSNKLLCYLWQCNRDNAPEMLIKAKKALKGLMARPTGLCLQEIGLSIAGVIAREAGDYKLAKQLLCTAVERCNSKEASQILSGSSLHLAKLCYDTGDQAGGEKYLKEALGLAVDNKYMMFWDIHFPTLVEMTARSIKIGIHAKYAQQILARYYGIEAAQFLQRAAANAKEGHFNSVSDVFLSRYGVHDEPQPPQIYINLLGRFKMSVDGITIPEKEWKTKKIVGVLKFLVAQRGWPVTRDQLMEIFWPDADKKSASMSLRAALYELKKVLRKYGVPAEGKASFLNERRNNLEVSLSRTTVVDVDELKTLFNQLQKLPVSVAHRDPKKHILVKLVELYKGDFLEEELYEDWPFAEREEIKSIYLTAINELADIYTSEKDSKAEKLLLKTLAKDPYNEDACLSLLRFYIATNQKGRAVRLYSSFIKRFENELGIKPNEKLASVFEEQG